MRHVQVYRFVSAIARQGSIRRAAEDLSISPSALNRRILALEEQAGVPLFERLAKGVRLSAAGEVYLRCFRLHLVELERAASQVADLSGLRTGTVRLGIGEELANGLLPHAVSSYQASFPGVDFELATLAFDEVGPALTAFDVDLVVAANTLVGEDVESVFEKEVPVIGVCDAGSAGKEALRFSDLVDRPLVVPTLRSGLRNAIDAGFVARRCTGRYVLATDRLALRSLRSNPHALQLALEVDLEPAALRLAGLDVQPLASRIFRTPVLRILRARGRVLPVATSRFAEHLIASLTP